MMILKCLHGYLTMTLVETVLVENKGAYLRMRTQMATKEYANRVPMDMRSTRAARSNRKAIKAVRRNKTRFLRNIYAVTHLCKTERGTKKCFNGSDQKNTP